MNWVCLVCGWRGTEEDRIKTYTEETVMGMGALEAHDNCHFYEMGFRAGWDCSPLVEDIGQSVSRVLCDNPLYNARQEYYSKHGNVYVDDKVIKDSLGIKEPYQLPPMGYICVHCGKPIHPSIDWFHDDNNNRICDFSNLDRKAKAKTPYIIESKDIEARDNDPNLEINKFKKALDDMN